MALTLQKQTVNIALDQGCTFEKVITAQNSSSQNVTISSGTCASKMRQSYYSSNNITTLTTTTITASSVSSKAFSAPVIKLDSTTLSSGDYGGNITVSNSNKTVLVNKNAWIKDNLGSSAPNSYSKITMKHCYKNAYNIEVITICLLKINVI